MHLLGFCSKAQTCGFIEGLLPPAPISLFFFGSQFYLNKNSIRGFKIDK